MSSPSDEKAQEPDLVLRASQVFERWLVGDGTGEAEPFEQLTARHPELKNSLERLRRMDAFVRAAFPRDLSAALPADARAKMLGDYRILREIGRGAMGIVFEAEQMSLHRRVALKVLPAHLTLNERALKRFQHEAEITARLNHRNIISIHQVGEVAGVHFIAMELIEGSSLDKVIERMRRESFDGVRPRKIGDVVSLHGLDDAPALAPAARPPSSATRREHGSGSKRGSSSASNKNFIESAVKLVCHVAEALHHAHQAGVIHRDVKPSNILVRPDGSPVLTDFGLAREDGLPSVSQTGDFAGTPNFVSPEQAMSGRVPVDHRADVFSLGATLYELLTLEQAFPGETIHEILSRILSKQPIEPHKLNPALAPDLVTIVMKALEKDPDRRYATAAEFAEDLRSFIEYRPIRAKRTPTVMRAWRWAQREPLKAVLAAVLGIGLPVTGVLGGKLIVANARISATGDLSIESDVKRAFLDLGLARDREAEQAFRVLLEEDDLVGTDQERVVVVGLSRALLNQDRFQEAEELLSERQRGGPRVPVLERLRADALRKSGRESEAAAIERDLAPPASTLENYVEAVRLLGGTSYARRPDIDARVQERERARAAASLLKDAVLGDNERAPYYFAWAWAAWVAEDPAIARDVAKAIPKRWKDEAFAWFYTGVAREVFDRESALEAYAEAARLDPETVGPEALQRRAALRLASDPAGAAADFEELARAHPERADFLANLAVARVQSGAFEAALEPARRAIELEPDDVTAHDARGDALDGLGRYEEARAAHERCVELEPMGAGFHNDLGLVLMKLEDFDGAREHLRTANRLDPEYAPALLNLGLVQHELGEFGDAVALLQDALELHAADPEEGFDEASANALLGLCLNRLGETRDALAAFQRACELAPERADIALFLGQILYQTGRRPEAVEPLLVALRGGAGGEEEFRGLVAELEKLGLGRHADWLDIAKRWTERFPSSALAWNQRAWIQIDPAGDARLRDPADAVRAAEEAVRLSQARDAGILDTYACALHAIGQRGKALENVKRALELAVEAGLSPQDVEAIEGHLRTFEAMSE